MKHVINKRFLIGSTLALGAMIAIPVIAQQASPPVGPNTITRSYINEDGIPVTETVLVRNGQPQFATWTEEDQKRRNEVREALVKWRSSGTTEQEKKDARDTIAEFLKEEFEKDLKNRKDQIVQFEEQLAKLRHQVTKREESQAKVIELRMQLLENDSEGLTFPEAFNELQSPRPLMPMPVYSPYSPGPSVGVPPQTQPYYGNPLFPSQTNPAIQPQSYESPKSTLKATNTPRATAPTPKSR